MDFWLVTDSCDGWLADPVARAHEISVAYDKTTVQHFAEDWGLLVEQHAVNLELLVTADEGQVGVEWVLEEAV